MSNAELSFYLTLKTITTDTIFTKVRLEDIIEVKPGTPEYHAYRNRIKSRHVDFVLCDPQTGEIKGAIELNDKSHNQQYRKERDEFIRTALQAAGIKLVEIPAQKAYTKEDILKHF